MNKQEQHKYEIIKKLVGGEITIKEAMLELNQSRRNINRLKNKFISEGENGFIHKNKGKSNKNKKDKQVIENLENLYLAEYYDYNFTAFYEEISNTYDISYDAMLKAFKKDDIISPISHKNTIKLYNEKMNNAINSKETIQEEKIELYKSRITEVEKAHIRRSSNLYAFGQEVQMDACFKLWFGGITSALHLAVDKGTKKVLFGWFEFEELTRAYFILLYNIIVNYGIPNKIKTDNRNTFSNRKNKVDKTQFGIICNKLRINLVTTSKATSKPNVERENSTFKNRLIAELRHEGITTIDEANNYLNNVFIPKINQKFSYKIDEKKSMMKKNDYSEFELNLIISEKYERIIDNASSIKYNTKYYVPVDPNTGEIITFMAKTKCILIITYNSEIWSLIENKYYIMLEIETRESTMEKEVINKEIKEVKKYIPPANHPWRKSYKK